MNTIKPDEEIAFTKVFYTINFVKTAFTRGYMFANSAAYSLNRCDCQTLAVNCDAGGLMRNVPRSRR
ncbi:MAG: hypothetical protein ACE5PV_19645 [Candidatus Poribacteria bacterium]